ncbi:MAG: exonuclease domain-containing protein [Clostridia bacterium]|nr:exonuclease domain-containing protein [Clostridia bacterium]
MEYVIFDLEWSRYARRLKPRCPDEIIQIGAVKYNENGVLIDTFNRFIRPSLYKVLDPTVQSITGITMEKLLKEGIIFSRAIKEFRKFLGSSKKVLMSWGSYDAIVLKNNCQYYNKDINLSWLSSFADLQSIVASVLFPKINNQPGLTTALDALNIHYFEDTLHDALVDAKLSGEVFAKIFDPQVVKKFTVDATKISVGAKSIHITDLQNPMVSKREFMMRCPECGRFVQRQGPWVRKNKRFVASCVCRHCNHNLLCSVEVLVKQTTNEVYYKRRARVIENEKKCPKKQPKL